MSAAVSPPWVTDVGRLCERLSARLADAGARHPATAALVLIARGERGLPASSFAVEVGVAMAELAAAERGDIGLTELPVPLLQAARDLIGVELARVIELDTAASFRAALRDNGAITLAASPTGLATYRNQ